MRLFVAIELPEDLKAAIARVQEQLKSSGPAANWTRPEGIHLTLKFLGEVEETKAAGIIEALQGACRGTQPLRLEIAGAGAFPNVRAPRVLWVGARGDTEQLATLQAAVEDSMEKLGFAREARKFSPHLTLARIKFPKPRDNWASAIDGIKTVSLGSFTADHVSLMKSELRRDGAVYAEVGRIELK
jgi:2'-5' RNA ligase